MDVLVEILHLCVSLDKKASKIYSNFSVTSKEKALRTFWQEISEEEREHVKFWTKLLHMAKNGLLPQVFDRPYDLMEALRATQSKIDILEKRSKQAKDIIDAFLIAYRIEFYLLFPEFETLFHFVKTAFNESTPGEAYEAHLKKFIGGLNKHAVTSPELEFLGETILRFRELNEQLALQTYIDFLTGILNRRGLFHMMRTMAYLAHRNSYPIGIMMVDIDDFKNINDIHGHQKGDEILRSIAQMIKSNLRSSDVVGRYGGEEFLVFLSQVDSQALYDIAEKIRNYIEAESKKDIPVTISIGLHQGQIKGNIQEEMEDFIKKADDCLYKAKNSGRNKVVMNGFFQYATRDCEL